MKQLRDRVAVVTGAGSGIGRATAVLLARRGADVAIADVNEGGLAETARILQATGRRVTSHVVDVADKQRMQRFPGEVVEAHGSVHVVVNNAGVSVAATFEQQSIEDVEWLMGINFWGVVYGCKFFLPHLTAADEAHIVNISSIFGIVGVPLNSAYCASKFAVRGLSEAMRAELFETRVGVTSVHPGGVATNIVKDSRFVGNASDLKEKTVQKFRKMMPPEVAAERIVRGIEQNRARVLITPEAYVLDFAKRMAPSTTQRLIAKNWRRFAEAP